MTTIKKNWLFYLYLVVIILIGLYLNRFSFNRLPLGEDEMSYFGSAKRFFDYGLGNLNLLTLATHVQEKMLLFYLVFWPWKFLKNLVPVLHYLNFAYLVFYLGGLLSFYRLSKLSESKISRYLLPLFYVLIVSNTFWLGPRYFVPSLWLYIALPNIIYSSLKKKYIESIIWTGLTYFFYSFGFSMAGLVLIISTLITHLKPIWLKLLVSLVIFGLFYFFGMKYVGNFIQQIHTQSIVEGDLTVLVMFNWGFLIIMLTSLLVSLLYKLPIAWNQVFVALVMYFIFYVIVSAFPKDTSSYRLIVMLFTAIALALSAFPDIFTVKGWWPLALNILIVGVIIYYALQLVVVNVDQTKRDLKHKSIIAPELILFNKIAQECSNKNCLVISDPATTQIGSVYSPVFGEFEYQKLRDVLNDPADFMSKNLQYDHIIVIVSKRTVLIFPDGLPEEFNKWAAYSRSYPLEGKDPTSVYTGINDYSNSSFFQDFTDGLYAFKLK